MKTEVKKMVEDAVVIRGLIYSVAKTTGKLTDAQKELIAKMAAESNIATAPFDSVEDLQNYYLNQFLINTNLINGSGSLAETFNPLDIVEAFENELEEVEYEDLIHYVGLVDIKTYR